MGGMNVQAINLRKWRDSGVVMQDGKMFSDTILNNIVLDDEHIDYDHLREVCRIAQIETRSTRCLKVSKQRSVKRDGV